MNDIKKKSISYECLKCDYLTSKKCNYKNHLATQKHYNAINDTKKKQKEATKHLCDKCSKEYIYQSGLYRHKKMCKIREEQIINNYEKDDNINYKEMFLILINQLTEQSAQNKELHNTIIEQNNTIKEIIPKIGNNNNNNITNNVSIQVFLNDTCKDAMSLTDFINTIQVNVSDLLFTKENGLVKGISNLFLSNLEK